MKKIFFVAIAATLLAAGCQKTEVLNQVNPVDGTSMTFAPNMGKLTKAATAEGAGETNLSEQDFRLWAYYVAADPNRGAAANDVYDQMANIIISDNSGDWKATTTHFWPGKGKYLKFFAVSADSDTYGGAAEGPTATGGKIAVDPVTDIMTITGFTVNEEAPDTDLMIADYVEAKQKENDGESNTVDFTFRHALTKVQFCFRNTETNMPVYVQQMFVEGVNTVADLTVDKSKGTGVAAMAWGTPEGPVIFAGDYTTTADDGTFTTPVQAENYATAWEPKGVTIASNGYMKLTNEYKPYTTWLVIPQNVYVAEQTDLKVTIAYVIESQTETRQFVSTFSLGSAEVVPAWGINQYVKYNINLTPNIIGFDATVEDWYETSAGSDNGNVDIND